MKYKILLLSILLAILTFSSHAQIFNIGLKAGINSNTFITDEEDFLQGDSKIGLAGGLFFRIGSGMFSFQPEVLFSHKSGMITFSAIDDGLDTFIHASLTNIDFPLLVNFHPFRFARIGTGPVVSYPFREKVTFTTSQNSQSVTIDNTIFKEAAYSWIFCAALELGRFVIDARYELGIDKMNYEISLPNQSISIDPSIHSRTWQLTLGYKFIKPR